MDRRDFIKSATALAAAQGLSLPTGAEEIKTTVADTPQDTSALIDSAPVLQNFAETSIGIAFSVTDKANGYVIIGEKPDLSDARKVWCGGYRLTDMNADCMLVRVTGLKPATTYYYKIGADRIHYGGGYDMKVVGNEEPATVHSFTTAGRKANPHFCVINDTHARWQAFGLAIDKIAELRPSCVIWNGDACNTEETVEAQKRIFLRPEITRSDYAADIPYLFCPGNHDDRGLANRHLERIWMYRQPEERLPRDWDLGRNFAVRLGDMALIGLDTAEDKLDTNPKLAGLFCSGPYREAQTEWLRTALKSKEISSAKHLIAFCHIPLLDSNPKANPGDLAPADKREGYNSDFAAWQRTCAELWTPLLEKAGCKLIVTAHQHHYRWYAPTEDRKWAQVVGGGPDCSDKNPNGYPTVIEGKLENGKLRIDVYNVYAGTVLDTFFL